MTADNVRPFWRQTTDKGDDPVWSATLPGGRLEVYRLDCHGWPWLAHIDRGMEAKIKGFGEPAIDGDETSPASFRRRSRPGSGSIEP